jgi:D-3-phosphoglycerate dehydrogenase
MHRRGLGALLSMTRILVCDPIAEEGIKLLENKGYTVTRGWQLPKAQLLSVIAAYDAIIVRSATRVTAELLSKAVKLKVVGRAGEGLDNVNLEEARARGIRVVNTPHVASVSVAELTMAHMLALARKIVDGTNTLREGKWVKDALMGIELKGKTLGIVGCGSIGKTVERLALAFGMNVLAVDACADGKFVPLEEMLPRADFISIHVPLTPQTWHMISTREFNLMKEGVMLVDTSRGGVVDHEALYQALVQGKVKAAALDVFEQEPPGVSKLFRLENVIATPHVGAQTYEAQQRTSIEVAEKVIEALEAHES